MRKCTSYNLLQSILSAGARMLFGCRWRYHVGRSSISAKFGLMVSSFIYIGDRRTVTHGCRRHMKTLDTYRMVNGLPGVADYTSDVESS